MIVRPQLGFTYDCPHCYEAVSGRLEVFKLRSEKRSISCSCGKSHIDQWIEDNVLHVKYPCALCGKTHDASFLPERALSGSLCCLECPESGLPTGYVSTPERIEYLDSAENNSAVCRYIMELLGMEESGERTDGANFTLGVCSCGCRHFSAVYAEPFLKITCADCGKVTEIYSRRPTVEKPDEFPIE